MRKIMKDLNDFLNDSFPTIVVVTWLILVVVVLKLLITGAIR